MVGARSDGTVKVQDFGLAKILETAPAVSSMSMSPTLSLHATQAGVLAITHRFVQARQMLSGIPSTIQFVPRTHEFIAPCT
jgi:hypothetical protein